MSGILTSAASNISNIRELLKVYSPGFAFVKELFQNADDAAANVLRLEWIPGSESANHPLLKAPALVAINDGQFTDGDRRGLMGMGLGNKGGNAGKIGKFGLGTKSIFHVAEAFFFLESQSDPNRRDILNPWSPSYHQEWDNVDDEDWGLIDAKCRKLGEGMSYWFAIWIPLRRRADLDGIAPIVDGEAAYPGDETGCPPALEAYFQNRKPRIGELLPLLRKLHEVEFHIPPARRVSIRINREQNLIEQSDTQISYRNSSHSKRDEEKKWINQAAWPQIFKFKEEDGSEVSGPDKAEWSHSIVLTISSSEQEPKFRVYWSVFLPVGNEPYFEAPLPAESRSISIFLHGFFFLNSSRTEINGLGTRFERARQDDPVGICLNWNHDLACSSGGLLPSLFPALARWLDDGTLRRQEMAKIAKLVRNSSLWNDFRGPLTLEGSLLYCLANGKWEWRWIRIEHPVSIIPRIETVEELRILEGITTKANPVSGTITFAVDLMDNRALASDHSKFSPSHLAEFRELLGNSPELNENEAVLLERILRSVAGDEIPDEWHDVPVFRVKYGVEKEWCRVTLSELESLLTAGNLFRTDEHELAPLLAEAAEDMRLPVITSRDAPIQLEIHNLTYERSADWLLGRSELSRIQTARIKLVRKFATHEKSAPLELKAIRYLAHACPDQKNNDSDILYFPACQENDNWKDAYRIALDSLDDSWRLIDPAFSTPMSDGLKSKISMFGCTRENWPSFINSIRDHDKLDFAAADQAILDWIIKETPEQEIECLKHLKIHRLAAGEMVAAADPTVWLDGGIKVPDELSGIWRDLRESAAILKASSNPEVYLRQRRLFDARILDHSGALKLAVKSDNPETKWKLILHFLGYGTPRSDAIEDLRNIEWIPIELQNGADTWVAPKNILYLSNAEPILDAVLARIPDTSFHSSSRVKEYVRKSREWETLSTQIFPTHSKVFDSLERIFESAPDDILLGFENDLDDGLLDLWLKVVGTSEDQSLFPIRPLLAQLSSNPAWEAYSVRIARALARPFREASKLSLYTSILSFLKKQHASSPREQAEDILSIYAEYLRGAKAAGVWDDIRRDSECQLLSQSRKWRSSAKIAPPCHGVEDRSLLHSKLAEALTLAEPAIIGRDQRHEGNLPNNEIVTPKQSADNLEKALAPFREKLPEKAVAIFPALLGNEEPTLEIARMLLDGISVTSIRDELIPLKENDQQEWVFRIQLVEGDTVTLESIAGPPFQAKLRRDSDSIFLPYPNGQMLRLCGGQLQELCVASPTRFQNLPECVDAGAKLVKIAGL